MFKLLRPKMHMTSNLGSISSYMLAKNYIKL